ncbi:MAG: ABC transporter substrate-binding protein [Paludibacteraceae bacterium]|nr:ABC transporter substrate-binding protein [Paludibacteraceae bacterium]
MQKESSAYNDEIHIDTLRYARHFEIAHTDNYKRITIFDPWHEGQTLGRYYLVHDSLTETPDDGLRIRIPLQRLVIGSASYIGYLEALGLLDKIAACPDTVQIYSPTVISQVREGKTLPFGDPYAVNTETILRMRPDLIMMIGYAGTDQSTERLRSLRQPVITNVEWTEPCILGRAEWIKMFGAFYDLESEADSIFLGIEANYNRLKVLAQTTNDKPSILPGAPFRGTLYMPGGQGFMTKMFRDANGSYLHSDNSERESIGLDLETVVRNFVNADIWIGADATSMHQLLSTESRYALLKPVKTGQVYNNSRHATPTGGNLYWEATPVHPDWLLEDLIRVLHPDLLTSGEYHFLQQLK